MLRVLALFFLPSGAYNIGVTNSEKSFSSSSLWDLRLFVQCQQVIQSIQKRLCFKSTSQECKGVIIRLTQRSLLSQVTGTRFLGYLSLSFPSLCWNSDFLFAGCLVFCPSSVGRFSKCVCLYLLVLSLAWPCVSCKATKTRSPTC